MKIEVRNTPPEGTFLPVIRVGNIVVCVNYPELVVFITDVTTSEEFEGMILRHEMPERAGRVEKHWSNDAFEQFKGEIKITV